MVDIFFGKVLLVYAKFSNFSKNVIRIIIY